MVKLIEGNGIGNKVIAHFIDMKVCTFKCIEDFSRPLVQCIGDNVIECKS